MMVHAGDYSKGECFILESPITSKNIQNGWEYNSKHISLKQLEAIEIASEESVKRIGGAIGWGAVGGMLLGPVGLLAGLLIGGKKNEVTFVARFKDGRKMLATTDKREFTKLQAAAFDNDSLYDQAIEDIKLEKEQTKKSEIPA